MRTGDTVLSLACGGGEELALWAEAFGATSVMALEQSPSLAAQARQRAEAIHTGCIIDVHCADARRLPQLVGGRFERIVCVDAIYHLGPRWPLLRAARSLLAGGGGFAYTDLVLARGGAPWRRGALRLGAGLGGIGFADVADSATALERWRQAGFDEVRCVRLDEAVLDGFCAHAARQARRIGLAARASAAWQRVAATAWLIRTGRGAGLGYALYSGRAGAAPPLLDQAVVASAAIQPTGAPSTAAPSTAAPSMARTTTSAERTALSSSGMPGWA